METKLSNLHALSTNTKSKLLWHQIHVITELTVINILNANNSYIPPGSHKNAFYSMLKG